MNLFCAEDPSHASSLRLVTVAPNPGPGDARLEFLLRQAGRLEVRVYTVAGRLLAELGERTCAAGRQSVFWDKTASGVPVPCGVYLVRGILESGERRVDEARGRIVVLR